MSENITNDRRIGYLDIAKGISLFLVMISHSCGMPFGLGKYFFAFYIQIFFVLSGLTYKKRRISVDIKKRLRGVIVPYFIYSFVIACIGVVLGNIKSLEKLVDVVKGFFYSRYCFFVIDYAGENNYFMQIGNSPLWFLTAIFMSSCIFYVVVEYIGEQKKRLYMCSVAFVILTAILDYLPILLPWSIDTAFLGAFFMLVGYYGKKIYLEKCNGKILILVTVVYIVCCYVNAGINISIREFGNYGAFSVIAVCIIGITGSILCISFSRVMEGVPMIRNMFEFIGRNTIMLLALHVSIFTIFDSVLSRLNVDQNINKIVYYGLCSVKLIATVGVCFLIVCVKKRWIEKVLMR